MDAHHHGVMPGLAAPELAHHDHVGLSPRGTAVARALVTPTSNNAHLAVGAVEKQETGNYSIFDQFAADGKQLATLRAELAILGGFTLLELSDGSFLGTKWNFCRPLADLRSVAAFVRLVGGAT